MKVAVLQIALVLFQKRDAEHDQINGPKSTDNHDPPVRHRRRFPAIHEY